MKTISTLLVFGLLLIKFICSEFIVPPNDPNLYYTGRIDSVSPVNVTFSWSAIEIYFSVTGTTTIQVLFQTTGENYFDIYQGNIKLYPQLNITSPIPDIYTLAEGLDPSLQYNMRLTHRNEPICGIVSFLGVVLDDGGSSQAIPSLYLPTRKIEFIGDSITCGFGVLGVAPCPFTPETESAGHAYGYLVAKAFNAEPFIESWSGKGLVRNYDYPNSTSPATMPDLYRDLIPNNYPNALPWNFTEFSPDVVVINLGTNDFSTEPIPTYEEFVGTYVDFIQFIRSKYTNNPQFFLACGPMIGDPCCSYIEIVAQKTDSVYVNLQGLLDNDDCFGCAGHPNVLGHMKMANITINAIQQTMGWPL